ncbi:hypothetical protein Tco_1343606 [Tanacetum coccineum]
MSRNLCYAEDLTSFSPFTAALTICFWPSQVVTLGSGINRPGSLIDAAVGELCLAVLTGTCPDFVTTAVGTKFLLGWEGGE